MTTRKRRIATLLLTLATAAAARAGDMLVMAGDEPLKSKINEAKASVRLLFLGSPT